MYVDPAFLLSLLVSFGVSLSGLSDSWTWSGDVGP
jgi:hypothetical protein